MEKKFNKSNSSNYGKPLFSKLKYCLRCCLPDTNESIDFDDFGICKACRASEQKMHIDWDARQKILAKTLNSYKQKSPDYYDCMVPISGGKDSIFQLHVLKKVYDMNPLAVTFSHNWFTKVGKQNLETSIEKLDVDHIMFTPKRSLINRVARESLKKIGDACWHCHTGVETFPFQVAVKWNIPLLVYGESLAEFSGKETYDEMQDLDPEHFLKYSAKVKPEDMVCETIKKKEMGAFTKPSIEEIKNAGIRRIFLGDYMFWDLEKQTELVIKEYGWKEEKVEGTYKRYKSVECKMPGFHDYAKFIKRGFGRGTDFAAQDIRAGLLTREEGFELAKLHDQKRPEALDYYLKITGYTEKEFLEILMKHRKDGAKKLPKINKAGENLENKED